MKKILLFLLLSGCSGMSVQELEQAALFCDDDKRDDCSELRDRWDRYMERKDRRQKKCPSGYIWFEDHFRAGCVSKEDFERWIRRAR